MEIVRYTPEESVMSVEHIASIAHRLLSQFTQGYDYGVIPGTKKVSLLKPGMNKILRGMHLRPEFIEKGKVLDFEKTIFFFEYECRLYEIETGLPVASACGNANSQEKKWRYRVIDGKRVENPDIADQLNTISKMAQKRALAGAIEQIAGVDEVFQRGIQNAPKTTIKATQPRAQRTVDEDGVITEGVITDAEPHFMENADEVYKFVHWMETKFSRDYMDVLKDVGLNRDNMPTTGKEACKEVQRLVLASGGSASSTPVISRELTYCVLPDKTFFEAETIIGPVRLYGHRADFAKRTGVDAIKVATQGQKFKVELVIAWENNGQYLTEKGWNPVKSAEQLQFESI